MSDDDDDEPYDNETIENSVVMDMWDNMELFQFKNTIGLDRRVLLYKSVQLLVMNERRDRGEQLAKVQKSSCT